KLEQGNWSLLEDTLEHLASATREELLRQGVPQECVRLVRRVHLRYDGTDAALIVGFGPIADMVQQFAAAYRQRYSFLMPNRALVAEAVSVEAIGVVDAPVEVSPTVQYSRTP